MIYQIIVKLIKIHHHVKIEILKLMKKYDKIKIQISLHKIGLSHSSLIHCRFPQNKAKKKQKQTNTNQIIKLRFDMIETPI